jgi:hypothetical protein
MNHSEGSSRTPCKKELSGVSLVTCTAQIFRIADVGGLR